MKTLALWLSLAAVPAVAGQNVTFIRCESPSKRTVVTAQPGEGGWYYLTVVQDGRVYLHDNVATKAEFLWREIAPPTLVRGTLKGRTTGRVYLEMYDGETDYVTYDKNVGGVLVERRQPVHCDYQTD